MFFCHGPRRAFSGRGLIGYLSGVTQPSFLSFDDFSQALRDLAAHTAASTRTAAASGSPAQSEPPAARGRDALYAEGALHHLMCTAQLRKAELQELVECARAIRSLDAQVEGARFLRGLLEGQRVMLWFGQPSTRTAQSFLAASDKLGARSQLLTELSKSSMAKGETVEDSVRVMAELFDALVIRHAQSEFSYRAMWGLALGRRSIPVISAGMGPLEHVTQSLLDLLTLEDAWASRGGVQGKRVLIVGDIARNRAARSLAFALATCDVGAIDWVCPQAFAPDPTLLDFLEAKGTAQTHHAELPAAIAQVGRDADAIYMTRLQQEWDEGEGPKKLGTSQAFILTPELGDQLREDCRILHPLPRVNELPSFFDSDPRLSIWEQVRNGVWVRAAALATVLGKRAAIMERVSG